MTAAIFGLVGVLVGGLLTGVVDFVLDRLRERTMIATARRLLLDELHNVWSHLREVDERGITPTPVSADVDLGTGTLYVRDAKTPKGVREVHLTPALREALTLWRADANFTGRDDFVVHTSTGHRHNPSNLRRDVLRLALAAADETLEAAGISPIADITFHSLRRTYASLRCACGDDVRYAADQLGHEDPRFTLRVYAQATKRRERLAKPQRDAYDAALEWAAMGSNADSDAALLLAEATTAEKSPA